MAWDGNGNFTRSNGTQTGSTTWANSRDAGNNITASQHDTHDQDLADGIAACLTKNGETKPTADFRPNADATYDLGSSALRWTELYLSSFIQGASQIQDSSGNEILKFAGVASAVNEPTVTSAATGKCPQIAATGGDTNISQIVDGKGTGGVLAPLLSMGVGLVGGKITRAVGASALTLAVKTHAGNDPSATEPVFAIFPSVTSNVFDGAIVVRRITAALSLVISSGSTLGQTSAVAGPIYTYLLDNAGTVVLAASSKFFGGQAVVSTTAEGGAGGADTITTMYSTAAQTNVAAICIDRWKSTQTTAGTWAATTGEVQRFPFPYKHPTEQDFTSGSGTYTTPWDAVLIKPRLVGGGGGGGGQSATNGTAGGDTTFGALTAGGGAGGTAGTAGAGGAGGTNTVSGTTIAFPGAKGQGGGTSGAGGIASQGGSGGGSSFYGGGGGGGAAQGGAGAAGATNTGGGGGGGSAVSAASSAGGGGGGGSIEALIPTPAATYAYGVGAAGTGGVGAQTTGGDGAAGRVTVYEYYS